MPDGAPSTITCAYCLAPIGGEEALESCPACRATYHRECWEENGGCAVYGCARTPVAESRSAIEVPVSYWGRENKPCPSCGQEILAAAMRCRHCGATFTSARPQGRAEFQVRAALEERLPAARRRIITIFVLSLVPFLTPVGFVWGLLWRHRHAEELEALPALYGALSRIGLFAAAALTLALAAMTVLYVSLRT